MRIERTQRRMVRGEVAVDHLPHPLGTAKVFEAVHPEISQAHPLRQPIDDQPCSGVREEDLVAVSDAPQPSASDHGLAEVVALVAQLGLAGVDGHADVQVGSLRPLLAEEATLGVDGGGECIGRPRERGHDAVALSLLHRSYPAEVRDDVVHDLVVPSDRRRHPGRRPFPTPR
jgi:hypothetical protein